MEQLISLIDKQCKLNEAEKTQLRQTLRVLYFPKGSIVIGKGKIDDSIYFIREGVWRAFIERDGEELTLWFALPGESVFSSWGHAQGLPARYSISSSSNSVAIEMKKSVIEKLSETSPAFIKWLNELHIEILINTDNLLVDISSPNAEKRYLAFMKKMPEIFQHVPLKEIAGFIGVTPQSLSRIRSGLNKSPRK